MTRLSTHFVSTEFACPHCGVVLTHPALISGLERLRALAYPRGLVVRSGYRCPVHNRDVGGATSSQHLYGTAADVDLRAELAAVKDLGSFSGIGWQLVGGRQLVRHVDVRHATSHNTTGGTTAHPTLWSYS